MAFSAAFRCIAGCDGAYPLDQIIYKCPKCGDLLEVVHDIEALKKRSAAAWICPTLPQPIRAVRTGCMEFVRVGWHETEGYTSKGRSS